MWWLIKKNPHWQFWPLVRAVSLLKSLLAEFLVETVREKSALNIKLLDYISS
jgi:hypothetical protein